MEGLTETDNQDLFKIIEETNNNNNINGFSNAEFDFAEIFGDDDIIKNGGSDDNWSLIKYFDISIMSAMLYLYFNTSKIAKYRKLQINDITNKSILAPDLLKQRLISTNPKISSQIDIEKSDKDEVTGYDGDVINKDIELEQSIVRNHKNKVKKLRAEKKRYERSIKKLKTSKTTREKQKMKKCEKSLKKTKQGLKIAEKNLSDSQNKVDQHRNRKVTYILLMSYYEVQELVLLTYNRFMEHFKEQVMNIIKRSKEDAVKLHKKHNTSGLTTKEDWEVALYEYYLQSYICGNDSESKTFLDFVDESILNDNDTTKLLKFMTFAHTMRHMIPQIHSKHTECKYYLSHIIRDLNDFITYPSLKTPEVVSVYEMYGSQITSEDPLDRIPVFPLVKELKTITPPYNFSLQFSVLLPSDIRTININRLEPMTINNESHLYQYEDIEEIKENITKINDNINKFFKRSATSDSTPDDYAKYINEQANNMRKNKNPLVKNFHQREKRFVRPNNNNNNEDDDDEIMGDTKMIMTNNNFNYMQDTVGIICHPSSVYDMDLYNSDDEDDTEFMELIEEVKSSNDDKKKIDLLIDMNKRTIEQNKKLQKMQKQNIKDVSNLVDAVNNLLAQRSFNTTNDMAVVYGNSSGLKRTKRKAGRKSKSDIKKFALNKEMSQEASQRMLQNIGNVPLNFELSNRETVELHPDVIKTLRDNAFLLDTDVSPYNNNNNININAPRIKKEKNRNKPNKVFKEEYARNRFIKTKQRKHNRK